MSVELCDKKVVSIKMPDFGLKKMRQFSFEHFYNGEEWRTFEYVKRPARNKLQQVYPLTKPPPPRSPPCHTAIKMSLIKAS